VTPEILYGDGKKKGIINFLTVNSASAAINLNAAEREVLAAIPGIGDDDIEAILSIRDNPADAAGLQAFLGKITPPFNGFVTAAGTGSAFTIDSIGLKGDEKTGCAIRATVMVGTNPASSSLAAIPATAGTSKIASKVNMDSSKPPFIYLYYKSPADVKYDSNSSH